MALTSPKLASELHFDWGMLWGEGGGIGDFINSLLLIFFC